MMSLKYHASKHKLDEHPLPLDPRAIHTDSGNDREDDAQQTQIASSREEEVSFFAFLLSLRNVICVCSMIFHDDRL